MNHARVILDTLDGFLTQPVELTLFGRAALQLGFPAPPAEYAQSLDVDAVLWTGQAESLRNQTNFWSALDQTNEALAPQGLYISHLFEDAQVVLTPEWRSQRMPIAGPWRQLQVFRLGDGDLLLSKLMRYDPLDLEDARFIIAATGWDRATVRSWIQRARVPPLAEIREQFEQCSAEFS